MCANDLQQNFIKSFDSSKMPLSERELCGKLERGNFVGTFQEITAHVNIKACFYVRRWNLIGKCQD